MKKKIVEGLEKVIEEGISTALISIGAVGYIQTREPIVNGTIMGFGLLAYAFKLYRDR